MSWFAKPVAPPYLSPQARDIAATIALYERVAQLLESANFPAPSQLSQMASEAIVTTADGDPVPIPIVFAAFLTCFERIYEREGLDRLPPLPPREMLSGLEGARFRDLLNRYLKKCADPEKTRNLIFKAIIHCYGYFNGALPPFAQRLVDGAPTAKAALSVPLIDTLKNPGQAIHEVLKPFLSMEYDKLGLFAEVADRIHDNTRTASGQAGRPVNVEQWTLPAQSDLPARELARAYLAGTPFLDLFWAPVPFAVPESSRFEHTHILAGSGHGKTQTLQQLILSDLTRPDPPSLVIIDSQGDMLRKLSRLSLFDPDGGALADRLIIINPTDIDHPPALNLFDVNFERLRSYGPAAREQILNGVIELYDYIFGSLLGAELTQKQSVLFRYLARLMLTIPGSTIHTLIELMGDATPFMQHIEALPPGARLFFETEFPHKSFTDTKRQIQRRLWGILENPTFERMLTAPKNRVDMFDALNTGKIVLVNTAKDFLKAERSSFLGRLFIALTLQAALERAAIPEEKRRPAFLYIDEAADYFDDNIDDLLTQARKYKLGLLFSHQYLTQLAPALHSSIASNTSVKMAGGVSDRDARSMAPDMRTTPTFILEQRKSTASTQFACSVRNVTEAALSLTIPFGALEREAVMSDTAYAHLEAKNRARVSVIAETGSAAEPRAPEASAPQPPASASGPDEDWSS